jgi:hypothetical protein
MQRRHAAMMSSDIHLGTIEDDRIRKENTPQPNPIRKAA